jgi:hypothetical protein
MDKPFPYQGIIGYRRSVSTDRGREEKLRRQVNRFVICHAIVPMYNTAVGNPVAAVLVRFCFG